MEYSAMIYKNNRTKGYVANCIVKNMVGFGKTEQDAIDNLKKSLQSYAKMTDIRVKPVYSLLN